MTPPGITGAELAARIEAGARERGLGLHAFLEALTNQPSHWLAQLRRARHPRRHTIARIEKLLAGELAPPDHAAESGKARKPRLALDATRSGAGRLPPRIDKVEHLRVDRDACFLCGTRGDIGCRHKRRAA